MIRTLRAPLVALALAAALPAEAAAEEGAEGGLRDGFSMIEEGTRMLLRGLMGEMEPALRELQERIGDLSAYHAPEVLPNGDILIRRKTPLTPDAPAPEAGPQTDPDAPPEEIEL